MKCEESLILKTENFDKMKFSRNFQDLFFAVSVQNHEDIVESDNNIKITDNCEKLFKKINFNKFFYESN